VPYKVFAYILYLAEKRGWGGGALDAVGLSGAPLDLKILGVLFCLRGDHKFKSVKRLSHIDPETQRRFFLAFNASFSCDLFDIWVSSPKTEADIKRVTDQYQACGLPGCIGSIDCTHVGVDKMPIGIKNLLIGKEGYPTLSFEVPYYIYLPLLCPCLNFLPALFLRPSATIPDIYCPGHGPSSGQHRTRPSASLTCFSTSSELFRCFLIFATACILPPVLLPFPRVSI
jgi:hypothetical protein